MQKTKLKTSILTLFRFSLRFLFRNCKPAEHFVAKWTMRVAIAAAKVLSDIGLGDSSGFPSAIKMLEALPGKSGFGLIAKNQISLGQRRVAREVPGLANLEVAEQVCRDVRSEWNRHEGIE